MFVDVLTELADKQTKQRLEMLFNLLSNETPSLLTPYKIEQLINRAFLSNHKFALKRDLMSKIIKAKSQDNVYYNVDTGKNMVRRNEGSEMTFNDEYRVAGQTNSKKLQEILELLNTTTIEENVSNTPLLKVIVKNSFGYYELKGSNIVIDPKTQRVLGSQDESGEIIPLNKKQIDICQKLGYEIKC